jgi:hypothetical protein
MAEINLIICVCLIPIFLSFWIFSGFNYGDMYIKTVITYSLFGTFKEIFDVYLKNKERAL